MLEVLRALKAGPPLRNDVVALFTDGEEAGLLGAWGFVGEHRLAREVGLVLNSEARGAGGPSLMFETSGSNGRLIEEFGKAVSRPVASSLSCELYKLLPNDTDLSAFKKSGMAGLNFAFFDDAERYHTALDTAAGLDERSLQHHGLYGLELTRHFGNLATDYPKARDAVYFDILGFTVVSYSASWAVPLAVLATVLLAFAVWLGLRRKAFTLAVVGVGALLLPVAVTAAWLAVSGVWRVVALLRPDYALFGRGEIYNSDYYALGFSALAAAVTTGLYVLLRVRFGGFGRAAAPALPLTPPACELLEEGTDGGLRTLRLRVSSRRRAPTLSFYLENAAVERGAVNGKALEPRVQADGDAGWELRYYGVPADGLDLSLTVRPNGPLKVRVVDQSYGLAEVSGAGFGPRPAGLMPMSQPTSDVVLVSKSYVF